jgi:hypothetical protein
LLGGCNHKNAYSDKKICGDHSYSEYANFKNIKQGDDNSQSLVYPVYQDEARCMDIPFPITMDKLYDVRSENTHESQLILEFKADESYEEIIHFYRAEMECLGWHELKVIHGHKACLIFQKPTKMCIITIEKSLHNCCSHKVVIYISPYTALF